MFNLFSRNLAGRAVQTQDGIRINSSVASGSNGEGGSESGSVFRALGDIVDVDETEEEVIYIVNNTITESSVKRYANDIVNFLIWVFDDGGETLHSSLFKDWFLYTMKEGHEKDMALSQKTRVARRYLRKSIKDVSSGIRRDNCTTHPICFEFLNFKVLLTYLITRQKTIKVKRRVK